MSGILSLDLDAGEKLTRARWLLVNVTMGYLLVSRVV